MSRNLVFVSTLWRCAQFHNADLYYVIGKRDNGYPLNYGTAKSVTDAPPPTQQNSYQTGIPLNFRTFCLSFCDLFCCDRFYLSVSLCITVEIAPSSPASIGKRFSPAQISANQPPQRRDKKSPDSTTQPTHSPAPVTNTDTHLPNTTTHLPPDYETLVLHCRRFKLTTVWLVN